MRLDSAGRGRASTSRTHGLHTLAVMPAVPATPCQRWSLEPRTSSLEQAQLLVGKPTACVRSRSMRAPQPVCARAWTLLVLPDSPTSGQSTARASSRGA